MIKTLCFDFDGTLHDTKSLYGEAFRTSYRWLVDEGLAPEKYYSDEEVSIYLGMSAPDMWNSFMPELEPSKKQIASKIIGDKMDSLIYEGKARLYDGTRETLDCLKAEGFNLVILSNCRRAYIDAHREFFRLDRWFSAYYPAQDYSFAPKWKIMQTLMREQPADYAVIGDRFSDIEAALKNGAFSIGCLYGFGQDNELNDANIKINTIFEIKTAIKMFSKQ